MKRTRLHIAFWLISLGALDTAGMSSKNSSVTASPVNKELPKPAYSWDKMTIVFVICEDRYDLGAVAVKSAIAFSTTPMHVVFIADNANMKKLQNECLSWPESVKRRVICDVKSTWFPESEYDDWYNMFRVCSTQRLFLPSILRETDAVLYADTDVVFVHPVEDAWRIFYAMNKWELAALTAERQNYKYNYYSRRAQNPYVKPFGINSGVMLMNLTRMRSFNMKERLRVLKKQFKGRIPYGDQDLLNILFSQHRETLHRITCRWNYLFEHCNMIAVCSDGPVAVLHGWRDAFTTQPEPGFVAVHQAMKAYKLEEKLVDSFILPLKKILQSLKPANCAKEFARQLPIWKLSARRIDNAKTSMLQRKVSFARREAKKNESKIS